MGEGTCNSYWNPRDAALFAGKVAGEPVGNVLSAADLVISEEGARLWSHHVIHPSAHGALWSDTRVATPSRSFDSDQSCTAEACDFESTLLRWEGFAAVQTSFSHVRGLLFSSTDASGTGALIILLRRSPMLVTGGKRSKPMLNVIVILTRNFRRRVGQCFASGNMKNRTKLRTKSLRGGEHVLTKSLSDRVWQGPQRGASSRASHANVATQCEDMYSSDTAASRPGAMRSSTRVSIPLACSMSESS